MLSHNSVSAERLTTRLPSNSADPCTHVVHRANFQSKRARDLSFAHLGYSRVADAHRFWCKVWVMKGLEAGQIPSRPIRVCCKPARGTERDRCRPSLWKMFINPILTRETAGKKSKSLMINLQGKSVALGRCCCWQAEDRTLTWGEARRREVTLIARRRRKCQE